MPFRICRFLPSLTVHRWSRLGVAQFTAPVIDLGISWTSQPASFLPLCPGTHCKLSSTALISPSSLFYCSQSLGLPHSSSHHQDQLHYFAQAKFRVLSPNCCRGHTTQGSSTFLFSLKGPGPGFDNYAGGTGCRKDRADVGPWLWSMCCVPQLSNWRNHKISPMQ